MHNRRRSAKRKLWEITTYKHEQHISDSDDDREEKMRNGVVKKPYLELEKTVLENWISPDSSSSYGEEFKQNETLATALCSEEETLIEAVSCSDDDSLHNSQISISEISCSSKKSVSFCTKQTLQYDFSDDSCDNLMSPAISDIEESQKSFPGSEQACNISISPPSSPLNSSNFNTKGSEWLSAIPWQPRTQKKFCSQREHCSDKKKKKYTTDGFADQLHRLQSREKTAKAFWDHHSHNSKSQVYDKESLILKLTDAECCYGTAICRAVSLKLQLDDESFAAKNITSEKLCENYIVFLDYEQYEKLNLSTGCVIQIFPPWKFIGVKNLTEPVLLCSYFLQVLKKD